MHSKAFSVHRGTSMEITLDNGSIITPTESIDVTELIKIVKLMKRLALHITADPELSKQLPYVVEATHDMLLDDLKK